MFIFFENIIAFDFYKCLNMNIDEQVLILLCRDPKIANAIHN